MSADHGRTWVLLRGLTREQRHWGAFADTLREALDGAPVVAIDLPGAGVLHAQRCPTSVPAMLPACRAQLAGRGIDGPLQLVGLSLGGMVAAHWASAFPDEVAALALVNTSARDLAAPHRRLRLAQWPALLAILRDAGSIEAEQAVLRLTSAWPSRHADAPAAWAAIARERPVTRANALRQLLAAARCTLPPRVPRAPVLVVSSRGDALVDAACSAAIARRWGATHEEHPAAGHDLPLDDGPWLARRIAAWARRQGRA